MSQPEQSVSSSDDFLAWLRAEGAQKGLAVAFSGGLDSRFLVHMALLAKIPVLALHAQGPHMARSESLWARTWAQKVGLPLQIVDFQPLTLEGVRDNSPQRCYLCKQALIRCLQTALAGNVAQASPASGIAADTRPNAAIVRRAWLLCDGTNADDLQAHRPGLRALQEAGVRSPLAECGISKTQIRQWAQQTGLENPQQKARPCLLTRLAYGVQVQTEILERIAAAEDALALVGLQDFRLRLTPAPLLQSLPLTAAQRSAARTLLQRHGFSNAHILEEEVIGGFFDR